MGRSSTAAVINNGCNLLCVEVNWDIHSLLNFLPTYTRTETKAGNPGPVIGPTRICVEAVWLYSHHSLVELQTPYPPCSLSCSLHCWGPGAIIIVDTWKQKNDKSCE